MTKNAPRMKAPIQTWTSRCTVDGLKTIAQKSTISARSTGSPSITRGSPSRSTGTMWWPAGVCCQLLATTIQIDEKIEPSATMQVEKKCILGDTRSQPKTSTRQEAGLEEEGEDALGGQRRAEHVADEARVGGPVGAELELHDDAGGDADGEVEGEDPGPEPGRGLVERVAGARGSGPRGRPAPPPCRWSAAGRCSGRRS